MNYSTSWTIWKRKNYYSLDPKYLPKILSITRHQSSVHSQKQIGLIWTWTESEQVDENEQLILASNTLFHIHFERRDLKSVLNIELYEMYKRRGIILLILREKYGQQKVTPHLLLLLHPHHSVCHYFIAERGWIKLTRETEKRKMMELLVSWINPLSSFFPLSPFVHSSSSWAWSKQFLPFQQHSCCSRITGSWREEEEDVCCGRSTF